MAYLTQRQQQVLRFIEASLAERGVAPTLREIAEAFAFRSTASAQKHVALLAKKGYVRREKHQKRGLVLARGGGGATLLPLLGVVAAGSPIESLADAETISVPPALLASGEHYVLRVRGDSMIDDGIHDGDMVIVQQRQEAGQGDMVVALVGGEVTLKRLFRDPGGRVRLQPANPTLAPLVVAEDEVRVQGVVVGLLRRY